MAKIEDILKRAVETEDWLLACNLYTQITGKPLSPPSLLKLDYEDGDEHEIGWTELEEESTYKVGDTVLYQSPSGKKPQKCEVLEVVDSLNYVIKMKQNGRKYTVNVEEISVDVSEEETAETPTEEPETNSAESFVAPTRDTNRESQTNGDGGMQMKSQPMSAPKAKEYVGVATQPFKDTLTDSLVDADGNSLLQTDAQRKARKKPTRGRRSGSDTNKIIVECSICENTFSVSPSLATGYVKDRPGIPVQEKQNTYKCNDCNSSKGRARQAKKNRDNPLVGKRRG